MFRFYHLSSIVWANQGMEEGRREGRRGKGVSKGQVAPLVDNRVTPSGRS